MFFEKEKRMLDLCVTKSQYDSVLLRILFKSLFIVPEHTDNNFSADDDLLLQKVFADVFKKYSNVNKRIIYGESDKLLKDLEGIANNEK